MLAVTLRRRRMRAASSLLAIRRLALITWVVAFNVILGQQAMHGGYSLSKYCRLHTRDASVEVFLILNVTVSSTTQRR